MKNINLNKINWQKNNGLIPAIIQNFETNKILMLGYMNKEALKKTLQEKKVWFFSRSRQKLWLKGETSKNFLNLISWQIDCDNDAILIKARPEGTTCHLGKESCFDSTNTETKIDSNIITKLFQIIEKRKKEMPKDSYTAKLFKCGIKKIEEKVMEEAEEVCRAAKKETKQRVTEESVDIIYHLLVLVAYKNIKLEKILEEIKKRM